MSGNVKKRWIRAIVGIATMATVVIALVIWRPSGLYPWFKAFHVIAVMSWMAGMLYLPRLFVYHCGAEKGSRKSETFKVIDRRLLRGIINPPMMASEALGVWIVSECGRTSGHW